MILYIIGIVVFSIIFICCIFLLIYYIKDEKKLKEVSDDDLIKLGKVYSKQEFEDKMFKQYTNIIEGIQYLDYNLLKDIVSDEVYNQILKTIKDNQDKNVNNVITDIKKDFSKLISLQIIKDLEVAKIWVKYSSIEYITSIRKIIDENNNEVESEIVIGGDKNNPINHEYILTFVKSKTETENVVCPSCGYQTNILTSSKCIRCDSEIVPKKMHWVYVDKVITNIEK